MLALRNIVKNNIKMNLCKKSLTIPQAYQIVSKFDADSTKLAQYLIDWDADSAKNVGPWSMGNVNWVATHLFEMLSPEEKAADLVEITQLLA